MFSAPVLQVNLTFLGIKFSSVSLAVQLPRPGKLQKCKQICANSQGNQILKINHIGTNTLGKYMRYLNIHVVSILSRFRFITAVSQQKVFYCISTFGLASRVSTQLILFLYATCMELPASTLQRLWPPLAKHNIIQLRGSQTQEVLRQIIN